MDGRGAAEGDHGAVLQLLAALDGVHARGIGHVLLDDLADAKRRVEALQAERRADRLVDGDARLVERELDRAAGEVGGIDAAQHDVGIGHGGLRAAAAVARRAGLGAGAFRADIDARQRIDRGDRAAAGADLDHLDHRDAQRQAAALQEAVLPRHLEGARMLRLAVVDQADLGRRAAHVEATAPCRGRIAAPAPPPGWRRRPGPTRRGGSGTCAPSPAPRGRRPR